MAQNRYVQDWNSFLIPFVETVTADKNMALGKCQLNSVSCLEIPITLSSGEGVSVSKLHDFNQSNDRFQACLGLAEVSYKTKEQDAYGVNPACHYSLTVDDSSKLETLGRLLNIATILKLDAKGISDKGPAILAYIAQQVEEFNTMQASKDNKINWIALDTGSPRERYGFSCYTGASDRSPTGGQKIREEMTQAFQKKFDMSLKQDDVPNDVGDLVKGRSISFRALVEKAGRSLSLEHKAAQSNTQKYEPPSSYSP